MSRNISTSRNISRREKLPAYFISHGSPMMALEKSPTTDFLQKLGEELPAPEAIVIFSAHMDRSNEVVIVSGEKPETVHDFYGFPEALYQVNYPAPGEPELAGKVRDRFEEAGHRVRMRDTEGWDHGVWIPLQLMFPDADIPVVQVSINSRAGAVRLYEYGKLVADLRDKGVLIIGSGGISHNLGELFNPHPEPSRADRIAAFTAWVHDKLTNGDVSSLLHYTKKAPHLLFNHPTPEHFLPLFAVLGSAGTDRAQRVHQNTEREVLVLDAYRFG